MLEEEAIVIKAEDEYIWVEARSSSSCSNCSAKQGCGTASLQKWYSRKPNQLRIVNTKGFSVGDKVIIGIPEQAVVKGSFMIYMLPLLALIAGAIAGSAFGNWLYPGFSEVFSIVTGFAAFLLCFRWLRGYTFKYARRADYQPIALRLSY
ncbi:MAG: SoxR reducing system RseC family protein [Gammaproteobacteria bacterium]|nr:SoxR reducing system RseC family protein [Gammaproteobacteria bacterium]